MAIQNQNLVTLVCATCQAVNRFPSHRLGDSPVCGKCKQELLSGHPINLTDATFQRFISRTSLPVLVDFWAAWCGPCKMMAPAFEQASELLSPQVILAKVNTEEAPNIAQVYRIQSIPTLTMIIAGKEHARQSGAMNVRQLVEWARANVN
jgi:thioredoxin 2